MREIRLYGSEGGGAARSPYPYQACRDVLDSQFRGNNGLRSNQSAVPFFSGLAKAGIANSQCSLEVVVL